MSVQPFYSPKFRAFDANGNPLSGGKLYSYAAGTTTPLATYTTRAGTTANANPVILNANGEADVWMTAGTEYKFELRDSAGSLQWTVDNVPSPTEASVDTSTPDPGGILTLSNTAPLAGAVVTAATTVYYVPYKNNQVGLWDGTAWVTDSIGTGISQTTTDATKSPAAVANDKTYDMFVWDDGGTVRLSRGPAWSTSTARGTGVGTTELERLDGRWVNKHAIANGPAVNRGLYVGSIRSDGSAQLNDSVAAGKQHVWNLHNLVEPARFASEVGWPVHAESTSGTAVYGKGGGYGGYFENQGGSNPALGVGAGHLKLAGSNPLKTDAYTNAVTPISAVKAWASITTNGSGSATLNDGFNIASAVVNNPGDGTYYVKVTLASAMASSAYAVFPSRGDVVLDRSNAPTSTVFYIYFTNGGSIVDASVTARQFDLLVLGRQ